MGLASHVSHYAATAEDPYALKAAGVHAWGGGGEGGTYHLHC
jgi:hypothetical protein